jgi:hypothetical protein
LTTAPPGLDPAPLMDLAKDVPIRCRGDCGSYDARLAGSPPGVTDTEIKFGSRAL